MHTMEERLYTDEQAQEILRLAAQSSAGSGMMSSRQLQEAAAELGIRPEEVIQAENAYLASQELEKDRVAFKKHKQKQFLQEICSWASGAILLYGIALVSSGFEWRGLVDSWPKWPVGFWTVFLLKDAIEFAMDLTVYRETAFTKWRAKRDKKLAVRQENENKAETYSSPIIPTTEPILENSQLDQNQARS